MFRGFVSNKNIARKLKEKKIYNLFFFIIIIIIIIANEHEKKTTKYI